MSDYSHAPKARGSRQLLLALTISVVVFLAELIASETTGSIALRADAGHMFVDMLALLIATLAAHIGNGQASTKGDTRAELIGAFVNAVLLIAVMAAIAFAAVGRFFQPRDVTALPALIVASIGLVANLTVFLILHRAHHQSLNLLAAQWHVVTDGCTSGLAIVSNAIILGTGWSFVDPLLSLGIVALVGAVAVSLLLKSLRALILFTPTAPP